ncbi:DUF5074 domain-containing protein [Prevotella sp. HUN102]|uniref:DUF5074 domain-containing protein n=1 Tax=Prevotella sp. HUN102 TaxID=1392486 RepID=UPI001E5A6B2E|nr:DUF5074 domain-containing protein [Prevotella sp. HUN102]
MKKHHILLLMAILTLIACRQDDLIIYPDLQNTGDQSKTDYLGLYILNEGNMGTNKATLDYLDLTTGTYSRNIYPSRNPNMVKELGDVGNDIKIYGNSLWMVINQSNKVEVGCPNSREPWTRRRAQLSLFGFRWWLCLCKFIRWKDF